MAGRGRPTAELVLTDEEHETLTRWARRRKGTVTLVSVGALEGSVG